MAPPGLHILESDLLPDLKDTEIALLEGPDLTLPAQRLKEHIVRSLG